MLDFDFEALPLIQLYRASDRLWCHQKTIESSLFSRVETRFELPATVSRYDLTNPFFAGGAPGIPGARPGRAKEKRADAPRLTRGLVVEERGFGRRSEVFAGQVSAPSTLGG